MFSYCLCPSSFDDVARDLVIPFFFTRLSTNTNKIILDKSNVLMYRYSVKCKENDIFDFVTWERMLSQHDSIVYGDVANDDDFCNFIYNLTRNVFTANSRTIVSPNVSAYSVYKAEIAKENIIVSTLKDAHLRYFPGRDIKVKEQELYSDIQWCIQSIPDRNIFKGASEDEYNDQVRDLLLAKGYIVSDQTRRGVSKSGYNSGEVDLLIKEGGDPFAIFEGLVLDSLKKQYIQEHLKKSLMNYDAIGLRVSFLVTYYNGKKFDDFSTRYKTFMESFIGSEFHDDLIFKVFEVRQSKYNAIKVFALNGTKDGGNFTNYQILVKV